MDDSWTKHAALVDALAVATAAGVRAGELDVVEALVAIVRRLG